MMEAIAGLPPVRGRRDTTLIYRVEKAIDTWIPISRGTLNHLLLTAADILAPLWQVALGEMHVRSTRAGRRDEHAPADLRRARLRLDVSLVLAIIPLEPREGDDKVWVLNHRRLFRRALPPIERSNTIGRIVDISKIPLNIRELLYDPVKQISDRPYARS